MTNESLGDKIVDIEFDSKFKYEIANQIGGENILKCFQCGTCAGICPIFEVDESYDPQKIIKMALMGMRKEVLSSELIWLCSTCYECYEYCPQNVKFTDLMCAIQNIATRDGYLAPALGDKIKLIKEHARTLPMDVFDNKKRAKFDLPAIEEKPEDISKIIENSGIEKLVGDSVPQVTQESAAETPPTEVPITQPPAETPPAETPPAEAPPVEAPPAEIPPAEAPPAETPLAVAPKKTEDEDKDKDKDTEGEQ